ncbi:hypothetical protein J6590_087515 [Homalodisca vitripennis]|nr:hypothetical protein J6590_087515 [Homalodisca vitripennis]
MEQVTRYEIKLEVKCDNIRYVTAWRLLDTILAKQPAYKSVGCISGVHRKPLAVRLSVRENS